MCWCYGIDSSACETRKHIPLKWPYRAGIDGCRLGSWRVNNTVLSYQETIPFGNTSPSCCPKVSYGWPQAISHLVFYISALCSSLFHYFQKETVSCSRCFLTKWQGYLQNFFPLLPQEHSISTSLSTFLPLPSVETKQSCSIFASCQNRKTNIFKMENVVLGKKDKFSF